jgi:hypothetical protein
MWRWFPRLQAHRVKSTPLSPTCMQPALVNTTSWGVVEVEAGNTLNNGRQHLVLGGGFSRVHICVPGKARATEPNTNTLASPPLSCCETCLRYQEPFTPHQRSCEDVVVVVASREGGGKRRGGLDVGRVQGGGKGDARHHRGLDRPVQARRLLGGQCIYGRVSSEKIARPSRGMVAGR